MGLACTRELFELRGAEPMERIAGALSHGVGDGKRVQAAFSLALDFHAWRRAASMRPRPRR